MASPLASGPDLAELIGDVDARTGQPDPAESLESALAATERPLDAALRGANAAVRELKRALDAARTGQRAVADEPGLIGRHSLPQRAPGTYRSRMNTMWGGACG